MASYDEKARLWNVSSGECIATLIGHSDGINTACFSSDDKLLATASDDNTARLWNVSSGECIATLTGHSGGILTA
jgi:WD40 repeat protein